MMTMNGIWKHKWKRLFIDIGHTCCLQLLFYTDNECLDDVDRNGENFGIEWENKQGACSMEIVYDFLLKHQHVSFGI